MSLLIKLAAGPAPVVPPRENRQRIFATAVAGLCGAWILGYKLQTYFGLETTSDMYAVAQLATSWLEGDFLQDRLSGNQLATHTFLIAPLLALFVVPFGPAGLFVALGLAVAASVLGFSRILRLLGLPAVPALGAGGAIATMPLAMHVYRDEIYGFHLELLVPALAAWLTYFVLRRQWLGAVSLAMLAVSVKEDVPVLVGAVGAAIWMEDAIRALPASVSVRDWCRRWNRPALAICLLAVVAVPLLLGIIAAQPPSQEVNNLARVRPVDGSVGSHGALAGYVAGHWKNWLGSTQVSTWLGLLLPATFGLFVLRPHFLLLALATTLTSWLVQDDLLWEPRFVGALAFFQVTAALALSSVWQVAAAGGAGPVRRRGVPGALVVLLAAGAWMQWQIVPATRQIYLGQPVFRLSAAERAAAERLFGRYGTDRQPGEAVIASDQLFRFADYRQLHWARALRGGPAPAWILWDERTTSLDSLWPMLRANAGSDVHDYRLVDRAGRFLLYRRKSPTEIAGERDDPGLIPAGDKYGKVRLKIRLASGRAGLSEPVLSVGPARNGELFFLQYPAPDRVIVGLESMGQAVFRSEPIAFVPGRTYELELFSGSMLPPLSDPGDGEFEEWRFLVESLVSVRWDGREVLRGLAPPHRAEPDQLRIGRNRVLADSAGGRFLGEVVAAERGGYPLDRVPDRSRLGAVSFSLQLPAAAAGVPEPLLVAGSPGDALLGYVRVLGSDRIRVGFELWGRGAFESEPVTVPAEKPVRIAFYFPGFFPPAGDARWEGTDLPRQEELKANVFVTVNDAIAVRHSLGNWRVPSAPLSFGVNPAGGSWVGQSFTGRILQVTRLPLGLR